MTKLYDPKYSTKVAFNAPIMREMLEKRDINLFNHWMDNGEPNKNLATEALVKLLFMQWIEALEILWNKDWITKKAFINKAWQIITSPYGASYTQPLKETDTEKWVINKTYNLNIFTKNEINNLHLTILDSITTSKNNYYWDMFFTDNLEIKGSKSKDIFWSLHYFSNHDYYNSNSAKNIDFENLSKERLERFISHKNGFEIEPHIILKILIELKDENIFLKIINSNLKMNAKNIFILATCIGLYYNGIKAIQKEEYNELENQSKLEILVKRLIQLGLPEKVIFTKKDLLEDYSKIFENGYIYLRNMGIDVYSLSNVTCARHLKYVYSGFYHESKIADETFNTGEAVFLKPVKDKFNVLKYDYESITKEERKKANEKFKSLINN